MYPDHTGKRSGCRKAGLQRVGKIYNLKFMKPIVKIEDFCEVIDITELMKVRGGAGGGDVQKVYSEDQRRYLFSKHNRNVCLSWRQCHYYPFMS